ncbi:MAG: EAL domain-containing protein, partial [Hyphomicrobiaceae bacterium]|nr:EAL domain-containing protein [Hyphomicrobiaceae bacterium]
MRRIAGSITTQFIVITAGLVLILATGLISINALILKRDQIATAHQHATTVSTLVSSMSYPYLLKLHYQEMAWIMERLTRTEDVRTIQVYDWRRARMIDTSQIRLRGIEMPIPASMVEAYETGQTIVIEHRDAIEVARPIIAGDRTIATVSVTVPVMTVTEALTDSTTRNAGLVLVVLALGLPFAISMTQSVARPIRRLSQTALKISRGDLDVPIETDGPIEVQHLSRSFRQMVRRIRTNMDRINRLAFIDPVTELPNRSLFRHELDHAIHTALRTRSRGAVLFIDLDHFKKINDTLGHEVGDKLLRAFAERVEVAAAQTEFARRAASEGDVVAGPFLARLGGDEFTMILPEIERPSDASELAKAIMGSIDEPFQISGATVHVGASIGIAVFPDDGDDGSSILKSADLAMYHRKGSGRGGYSFFSADLDREAKNRLTIETELREAIAADQFEVHYQPKIDCQSGEVAGFEALLRWRHPTRGMMAPGLFVPVAEDTGLIVEIGELVLRKSCRQLAAWQKAGLAFEIAVNASALQLQRPDFADKVFAILADTGADPRGLEIEMTETVWMTDPGHVAELIAPLRARGIRFAIDDFGT